MPRVGSDAVWPHLSLAVSGAKPPALQPVGGPTCTAVAATAGDGREPPPSSSLEQAARPAVSAATAVSTTTNRFARIYRSPREDAVPAVPGRRIDPRGAASPTRGER